MLAVIHVLGFFLFINSLPILRLLLQIMTDMEFRGDFCDVLYAFSLKKQKLES